jgi:hypothetical protein
MMLNRITIELEQHEADLILRGLAALKTLQSVTAGEQYQIIAVRKHITDRKEKAL